MIGSRSLLLILLIGCGRVLGQEILISEFLALNDGGITDEDGERSDWVEIQNRSASTLSLDGWYLTDVAIEPFKWRLPAVQLSPGESLLVFASGKDRAEAGSELHANFRLSGDGEYLALTRPDGTIAQDFAPAFSPQRADISYGIAQTVNTVILVSRPSTARIQIPASGDDGLDWTTVSFDDSLWTRGTAAVGYDTGEELIPRLGDAENLARAGTVRQSTIGFGGNAERAIDGDTNPTYGSGTITHTATADPTPWWEVELAEEAELDRIVLWNRGDCCSERLSNFRVRVLDAAGDVVYVDDFFTGGGNPPPQIGFEILLPEAIRGLTIRIELQGPNNGGRYLSLAEVEVFGWSTPNPLGTNNLALGKSATQSSTAFGGFASRAVDGNTDGIYARASVTHTSPTDPEPFWEVDLGRAVNLGRAVIWNRIDECCRERLSDFRLYVLDDAERQVSFSDHFADLGFPLEASYQVNFPPGTRGRFVGIQRLGPDANQEMVLSLAEVELFDRAAGLHSSIDTDLAGAMLGVHPGAYLRIPFGVEDPAGFDVLSLQMKYDDGFVAYLNGVEVARRNAPEVPAWDSRSPTEREAFRALVFEEFNITHHLGLLRPGDNVLAIHGLNVSPEDGNFLILPELAARTIAEDAFVYFNDPTPGKVNGPDGFPGFVADTRFSQDRGFFDAPFAVEITTETPGAQIRYTTDGREPTASRGIVYTAPVPITTTTVLRAAAFRTGLAPTNVDTHTYVFLDDVIDSSVMNRSITQNAVYAPQMRASLTDLPTISLVTGGSINDSVEVRTSLELISPDGSREFQEDAGVRRFGGAFTSFAKKNFRLYFRGVHGARKLKFPLFEGQDRRIPAVEVFDQLELRSGSHDMNRRGFYMSNRFTDDTMLDMGNVNPHGYFVHLYINGTYWGQYHLRERWNADMLAQYLGGEKEDYEAINGNWNVGGWADPGTPYDGNGSAWTRIKSLRRNFEAVSPYLDVPHYIDFMLMFMFGNAEAEYRCVGPTGVGSGFKFFLNDGDGFTRTVGNRTSMGRPGRQNGDGPGSLFSMLLAEGHPDYKILLADRIHKHFFNDGAMTPEKNRARLLERCDEVERAFISEAARWGYRTPSSWESAKNAYVNGVLPSRTATVVNQYRSAGFYPSVSAPLFNRQGGLIDPGFVLILRAKAGRILYTLNGDDPRLSGGAISPDAVEFQLPEPSVLVDSQAPVKVFVPGDGSLGLDWTTVGFDDSGWTAGSLGVGYERSAGYEALISTDVEGSMYQTNASVYLRILFEVADPSAFAVMTLGMRYDDGFVAYVNGKVVASRNAPGAPRWDSSASQSHSDSQAVFFESIDFDVEPGLLRAGTNVLAVHGMNSSTTSSDMLIFPRLDGIEVQEETRIVLNSTTQVQARALVGGAWSALNETTFVHAPLRVTEVMYHPPSSLIPGFENAEDFEFVELRNIGAATVELGTLGVRGGIFFDFSKGLVADLGPGEFVLLVRNLAAFEARYGPGGWRIAGEYTGKLGNRSDRIILHGPGDVVIQEFTYQDFWHSSTDGEGHSLVIVDETAELVAWTERDGWKASDLVLGSPGEEESFIGGRQLPSDANQDGQLDIGDVYRLLLFQYRGDALTPPCEGTIVEGGNRVLLDGNADGLVDLADAVQLLAYLFQGGLPPSLGVVCIRIEGCPSACVR